MRSSCCPWLSREDYYGARAFTLVLLKAYSKIRSEDASFFGDLPVVEAQTGPASLARAKGEVAAFQKRDTMKCTQPQPAFSPER